MARKTTIRLPGFKGVDDSGGAGTFYIPSGEYLMKCVSIKEEEAKSSGNDMITFRFEGLEKQAKGKPFRLNCTFGEKALWKLKQTLRACGIEDFPDDPSDLETDDLIGIEVKGIVTDSDYEGKTNSKLAEVRAVTDVNDDKPATKTKAKGKNGKPKVAASEVEDMAEDELFEINEKYDLDVDLDACKTTTRKRNAIIAALTAAKMLEA